MRYDWTRSLLKITENSRELRARAGQSPKGLCSYLRRQDCPAEGCAGRREAERSRQSPGGSKDRKVEPNEPSGQDFSNPRDDLFQQLIDLQSRVTTICSRNSELEAVNANLQKRIADLIKDTEEKSSDFRAILARKVIWGRANAPKRQFRVRTSDFLFLGS
jgi:hypothetical protein